MNLIVRITIVFVIVSLMVFLIGGYISYTILTEEVTLEQQRFLIERLERVERVIENQEPTDTIRWGKLIVIPLDDLREEQRRFSDTLVMHSQLDRMEPHLRLDVIKNFNDRSYEISLYDIVIEPDDIKEGVQESLTAMYLILLGAVLVIGFISSYVILRPFNGTLSLIKNFSLTEPSSSVRFPRSRIKEFDKLNGFLNDMTSKVRTDYQALKEFSENASHEMQTPIAIIQAKLEILLEGGDLNENQINQLVTAQNTLKRLSSLGSSLSLITKIENKEFSEEEEVDVHETLSRMLEEFKELFELKSLEVTTTYETKDLVIRVNKVLFELLLTNIINNAIRHNLKNGKVIVTINERELVIANSGAELEMPPNELFRRFKKSNQSSQSIGLGLAIVKEICELYDYHISYSYQNKLHTVRINF